jgi:hypothetical protein
LDVFDDDTPVTSIEDISVANMDRRFRIRCVGGDNLYDVRTGGFSKLCSKFDENCIAFDVHMEIALCFGGELICPVRKTREISALCSPRFELSLGWICANQMLKYLVPPPPPQVERMVVI